MIEQDIEEVNELIHLGLCDHQGRYKTQYPLGCRIDEHATGERIGHHRSGIDFQLHTLQETKPAHVFYDSMAVYGTKGWTYQSVTNKDGLFNISLAGDGEALNVFAKKGEDNSCWLGTSPDNLKKYSSQYPGTAIVDFSAYKETNPNNIAPDKAIYSGYINKFNTRLGRNSGTIKITDNLTGSTKMYEVTRTIATTYKNTPLNS